MLFLLRGLSSFFHGNVCVGMQTGGRGDGLTGSSRGEKASPLYSLYLIVPIFLVLYFFADCHPAPVHSLHI